MDGLCEISTYMTRGEYERLRKRYRGLELVNDDVKKRCYVAVNVRKDIETLLGRLAR